MVFSRLGGKTSGGCLLLGSHILKTWSATQASLALSSGEAEFYGVVKGAGIGPGQAALLKDIGINLPLRVWTDSSAAIGICGRQGLGKLRHVARQTLWGCSLCSPNAFGEVSLLAKRFWGGSLCSPSAFGGVLALDI